MISRRRLLSTSATVLGTTLIAGAIPPAQAAERGAGGTKSLRVGGSTAEYVKRPLGIGNARPRLGWPLSATAPGRSQSAYQIRVALSERALEHPDVWDSGKVDSPDSAQVTYGGPELRSRTRYHWTVRVWDDEGRVSAWSEPAWWETGLNEASDWSAHWIGAPASLVGAPALETASWIWFPEGDPATSAPAATRWFRGVFDVPEGVTRARLVLTADDGYIAHLDGTEVARAEPDEVARAWSRPSVTDVTERLAPGRHVLAVAATNEVTGPAGLLGALELTTADGVRTIATGGDWKAADAEPPADWRKLDYDDGAWPPAKVLAPWGSGPWGKVTPAHAPVAQLRHEFRLRRKPVERARLYSTALGLYEAHLNGERVGTDRLAPGWTDYAKRVQYRTHDVTELLTSGANTLAVELATGWYAGNVGMFGPHQYGEHPAFLGQLEVTYRDGTTERVLSGTDWRAATGPITLADLLTGENYDARRETDGWLRPGFDDTAWERAVPTQEEVTAELVAEPDGPCRVIQELKAKKITEPRPGVFVFDLGQNMVGTARLRVTGRAGTTVRLRHAEVLNPDGTVYTTNLRTAAATDHYTLKGGGRETYEPRFTFHGFRYVEVTGYPGRPPLDAVVGRVIHTDAPLTMEFETDVPLLNQLHSNITWGLRGNFLSIPTDTPARDERLGWTGDINVFAPTAAYTMESARFLGKWLSDLQDDQTADGAFTDVAPHVEGLGAGSAGWGDAGVTVPWALHQAYGDTLALERAWPSMLRWLDYLDAHSSGRLRPATGYGDWLNIADDTPKDVIATAYYAHSADLVARTARVLGKDPAPYTALFTEIREAFRTAYVTDGGRVKGDTQTAYVLALSMDLLSTAERVTAADRLVALIEAKDWHLSTGFLGTPRLLPVLTDTGHTDVAYRLLLQRTFPSWGYQIDRGATTMWERWDSIKPDGSFQDAGMNSFNHYAYGSVGEWMYAHITGIAPAEPGFRKVTVRPRPGGGITRARGRFTSLHGPVTTDWKTEKGRFRLTVTLPVNTTADVWIQAGRAEDVTHTGARFLRMEDGCAVFAVGSGQHRFEA